MAEKTYKIIQGNLNHSPRAQDLLRQHMIELDANVAIISEPAYDFKNNWLSSKDKKAAIYWNNALNHTCKLIYQGRKFVAVRVGDECIISVYISPNIDLGIFQEFLDELSDAIQIWGTSRIIVAGDFNAASLSWDISRFNKKGERLSTWAAEADLRLLNKVGVYTCLRHQGCSTIDLMWVSPDMLNRTIEWQVEEKETLSDHRHITVKILYNTNYIQANRNKSQIKRRMDRCDWDTFVEVSGWLAESGPSREDSRDIESNARWIESIMTSACDASTPRVKKANKAKKSIYWWNECISDLRSICIKARRKWTRARGKKPPTEIKQLQEEYKSARKSMRDAIRDAKRKAWQELLDALDKDPWGLGYRIVVGALRGQSKGLTETLQEESALNPLLNRLFPVGSQPYQSPALDIHITENDYVTQAEIIQVLKRSKIKKAAPGINGHIEKIWRNAPSIIIQRLAELFNNCLINGIFPNCWKIARLVLIPKTKVSMQNNEQEIKARPICVLNEEGKIFERIILRRIYAIMKRSHKARLSKNQFGFTPGKSTSDALLEVRKFVERALENRNAVIAVSLDIVNAFNTIPWRHIIQALINKGFPNYICALISNYLTERKIEYTVAGGEKRQRIVEAGVPQGSILGALLWNMAYNAVIALEPLPGCKILGYADDTLILASGRTSVEATRMAQRQTRLVIREIRKLNLEVATQKTEAIVFYRPRMKPTCPLKIRVGDDEIKIGYTMKYLGVFLDSRLSFKEHFMQTGAKASRMVSYLGRIMPNLRGPIEEKRKLYANAILSVILYAAPVWYDKLSPNLEASSNIRAVIRSTAVRVISAYRSTSLDAASLIAGIPPISLTAKKYRRVYERVTDLRRLDAPIDLPKAIIMVRKEEHLLMKRQWEIYIANTSLPGLRTRDAIAPHFEAWLDRGPNMRMDFHLTQIFTGHGCFGSFLFKIGKADTNNCMHCAESCEDTAEHTMEYCTAWESSRIILRTIVGNDLSLKTLVGKMTESKTVWNAVKSYAREVLTAKEVAERERERERQGNESISE